MCATTALLVLFFFFFILRRMGKNKALAHHTSAYVLYSYCTGVNALEDPGRVKRAKARLDPKNVVTPHNKMYVS